MKFVIFSIIASILSVIVKAQTINADNLKGSWLASTETNKNSDATTAEVNKFLASLTGSMRPLVCNYNGVILTSSATFNNGQLKNNQSEWTCKIEEKSVPDQTDALDFTVHFSVKSGTPTLTGVALAFDFNNWSAKNYLLVPGAVYDANRFRIYPAKYPPYIQDKKDKPLDIPITVTNIPHFNEDKSPAKIELLTGNASTPMMAFYDKANKRGFILLTEQQTRFGNSGMLIEENLSKKQASFILSAPGVREKRYVMTGFDESGDKGADWKTGDEVNLKMRLYNFEATDLQAFFERVFTVRKDLSGATQYRTLEPFSSIIDIILDHHDKTKWNEKGQHITQGMNQNDPWGGIVQFGWAGVPVLTYPGVIVPNDLRLQRLSKTLDLMAGLKSPSGLPYAKYNKTLKGDNHAQIDDPNFVLSRRFGETLSFGIQTLELLKLQGQGNKIKPEWEEMFVRMANGLVNLWNKYGEFGNFVNVETGEMDVCGSTSGAVGVTGLALASYYFNNTDYMEVAQNAARMYYKRDLSKGYSGGGAREMLQSHDSESTYNLVDMYIILYELTGSKEWLKYSENAAALLSTWAVSYKYNFPEETIMSNIHADATGSFMASTQNNHSAPSLFVHSGDFLLKLYRATGNDRYVELLKDLVHNVIQYTNTPRNVLQPINGMSGSVSERVNLSDWEGYKNIGGNIRDGDSNMQWEVGTMLSIMQNPGIYLNTDSTNLIVFDHVDAEIIKKDKTGITLKIVNNTAIDASVSIFAEDNLHAKLPLGMYTFIKWPKVEVKAGKTKSILIGFDGAVNNDI